MEIDLIFESAGNLIPYEIKSGMTIQNNYLDNLRYWQKIANTNTENLNVICGGDQNLKTSGGNFISWRKLGEIQVKND